MIKNIFKILTSLPSIIFSVLICAALLLIAVGIYRGGTAINELLTENKTLKKALTNLTDENKIGYAKVVSQTKDANGAIISTTLKFVETARDNELEKILEKQYTIEGDIVHFDALIVKFSDKMVMDGKKRSLYIWRRIYGEKMPPAKGFPIEDFGAEPRRYADLLKELPVKKREVFWSSIWDLANSPDRLAQYGITAVYGSVTYTQLKDNLIYIFRITPTGQVYPEVIPEF
ncbi:MAG: hypothetical protein ABSE89_01810 [Sedimentisphaerales bacterium]